MKQRFKFSTILAVIALLTFGLVLPAAAQDDNPVCTGLSAEDCQLLTNTTTAMAGVTSFAIPSWSFDFTLDTGSPEESVTFAASGSGEIMLPADPAASAEGLVVHFTLDDMTTTSAGESQSGSGELIIQGNMIYVFANGEWFGGEMTADDQASVQEALGGLTGGGDMGMSDMGGADMSQLAGLLATSAAQEDVDGQAATRFTTIVDLNVLLPLLSDPSMTEGLDETGQQMQMMLMMFGSMLQGTTISFEQVIGQEDNLLHSIAFNVDLPPASTEGAAMFTGGLHFSADFAQFDETFTVTPPESFRPLEELETEMDTSM